MALKKPVTPEAAKIRMADLCARSEQCEYDIRQKLYRMGIFADDASEIMDYLTDNKFIDNARFARSYARDKCRFSAWGPYKIRQGLAAKRVSQSDIATAIGSLEEDDLLSAVRRVAKAKGKSLDLHGEDRREQRMKLYRHILSRGFDSRMASMAVKEVIANSRPKGDEEVAE